MGRAHHGLITSPGAHVERAHAPVRLRTSWVAGSSSVGV